MAYILQTIVIQDPTQNRWSISVLLRGPSWSWSYGSWIYNYLCNWCISPLMLWVWLPPRASCATLCDKVCQWLATGRWFSQDPPVSSTNKTEVHHITEILLKMALNTIKKLYCLTQFPTIFQFYYKFFWRRKAENNNWFSVILWHH